MHSRTHARTYINIVLSWQNDRFRSDCSPSPNLSGIKSPSIQIRLPCATGCCAACRSTVMFSSAAAFKNYAHISWLTGRQTARRWQVQVWQGKCWPSLPRTSRPEWISGDFSNGNIYIYIYMWCASPMHAAWDFPNACYYLVQGGSCTAGQNNIYMFMRGQAET